MLPIKFLKSALKASITYRSEVKHKIDAYENFGLDTDAVAGVVPFLRQASRANGNFSFSTPQSVNLDFQTGSHRQIPLPLQIYVG